MKRRGFLQLLGASSVTVAIPTLARTSAAPVAAPMTATEVLERQRLTIERMAATRSDLWASAYVDNVTFALGQQPSRLRGRI